MTQANEIVVADNDKPPVRRRGPNKAVLSAVPVSDTQALIASIERLATDPTVKPDVVREFMEMRDRLERRAAQIDFDVAFAEMQPELPEIDKRGKIIIRDKNDKEVIIQSTPYALWDDTNRLIKPILAKHGFGLSFRTGTAPDGKVLVTVILSRKGHREETSMPLVHDSTGSKNSVQAVGSSISYGKRYTACAILNITMRGEDDDGKAGGDKQPETITDEEAAKLKSLMDDVNQNIAAFCTHFQIDKYTDLPPAKLKDAMAVLQTKKAKLKAAQ